MKKLGRILIVTIAIPFWLVFILLFYIPCLLGVWFVELICGEDTSIAEGMLKDGLAWPYTSITKEPNHDKSNL